MYHATKVLPTPESLAGKPSEAIAIDVGSQRAETGHQQVQANVELLATDKEGIRDVSLHHERSRICGIASA